MPSCCYADEYGEMFTTRGAHRRARQFVRRGLRGSARRLADQVAAAGVEGATILEVGGGIGQIHVELLRRGGAQATNVELSPNWEAATDRMLTQMQLRHRVDRRICDFVDAASDLPDADVVILHRVICCYPDWKAMVAAATSRARHTVGITLPADHRGWRIAAWLGNWLLRLQRRSFRAYVHPIEGIVRQLRAEGLELIADDRRRFWRTIVAQRAAPPANAV